ncbi:NAD(P)-binding protein [Auriscalpium vulgare]|uniref:NAD(P)-binding protein n=1 Tax=Auriscalpium vulgare TaxID=40419 RepID=A0ACB8S0N4_9AGAM|nr:NAD(P)-binding protein [Auriscalpium vulgare]
MSTSLSSSQFPRAEIASDAFIKAENPTANLRTVVLDLNPLTSVKAAAAKQTVNAIKTENLTANLRTLVLDLDSLASVKAAAVTYGIIYLLRIQVLINNAAVKVSKALTLTEDVECQFHANFLAHYLFTNLILGRIKAAASADFFTRIVNVSSSSHAFGPVRFEDYNFSDGSYHHLSAYGQSKTANILFTVELAKRYAKDGILLFSLHPGAIWTPGVLGVKEELIALGAIDEDGNPKPGSEEFKSLSSGVATHIVAAFDLSIKDQSGAYLVNCQVRNDLVSQHAVDPENAAKLWALAEKLVGQTFA